MHYHYYSTLKAGSNFKTEIPAEKNVFKDIQLFLLKMFTYTITVASINSPPYLLLKEHSTKT